MSCNLFPLQYENFICEPYDSSHMVYLSRFDVLELKDEKGKTYIPKKLEENIRDSGRYNDNDLLKTYLVYRLPRENENESKKELASVFCLRTSTMHFEKSLRENFDKKIVPCVELVYLAVDKNCLNKHPEIKGIGAITFKAFVVPIVKELNRLCGCKNLFLFAIENDKLINHYIDEMYFEKLPDNLEHYIVNNLKTDENEECKFLYQHICLM